MKKNVLFLLLLGLLTTVSAQPTHRIKGTVIDKASRQPLEFINVLVLGLGRGGVTDAEGHFNIGEVPPGIYRLQASAVGYKTILTPEYIVSTKDLTIQIETEENLTELEGVTVTASPFRRDPESPVGLRVIGLQEIEKSPGANRDISRIVQSYPGVAFSPAGYRNDLIVRGGSPSENRFYLDGVEIPNINHFSTQGASGGPVGIINADLIREVNFYTGAFPTDRGNAMSSVLDFKLRDGDMDYILSQAVEQAGAGADILDVNVGLPEIDEQEMMIRAVKAVQSVCDLPLQLDSTRADVLEAGLRVYNGKPIVNSVNGEQAVLDRLLPICKKYGAAVVGLTLDENGIPALAEQRFALAQKIVAAAEAAGIPREDVYIDCLTLTASAQQEAVRETLKAVRMVKERLGVKTVLGVSNISFGLPCREQVMASFKVLYNIDRDSREYLARYAGQAAVQPAAQQTVTLYDAVLQGLKAAAAQAARTALQAKSPEELVNEVLIPALDTVGAGFEKGVLFLPQLLQSAGAAQAAFEVVKDAIAASGKKSGGKGKIIVATVKGDIHDIGKNIVKTLLENYGYDVLDLGRDVPAETVVKAAQEHGVRLVGLSALMTTTLGSMEETICALRRAGLSCRVMVGGAVLTPEYAMHIGADYYAKDAKQSVDIAREVLG